MATRDIEKVAFWTGKWTNADQSELLVVDVDFHTGNFTASTHPTTDPQKKTWTATGNGGFSDKLVGKYKSGEQTDVSGQVQLTLKTVQTTDDLAGNTISCRVNTTPDQPPDDKCPEKVYTNVSGPSALVPDLELSLESMNAVSQKIKENADSVDKVRQVIAEFADKGMNVSAAIQPLEEQRDKMLDFVKFLKLRLHLLNYSSGAFASLIQPVDLNQMASLGAVDSSVTADAGATKSRSRKSSPKK